MIGVVQEREGIRCKRKRDAVGALKTWRAMGVLAQRSWDQGERKRDYGRATRKSRMS